MGFFTGDVEDRYRVGEMVREGEHFTVERAVERSVGADCLLHRIRFRDGHTAGDEQLAVTMLRNFGRVSLPRAPRVVDGWVASTHVAAVEYRWEAPSLEPQAAVVRRFGPRERGELLARTLFHLGNLHANNLVHREISPGCWGMDGRGKIYLLDLGIENGMVRALHQTNGSISLAGNLQARDLADWAFRFISFLLGEPVLAAHNDDPWDDTDFREADRRMEPLLRRPEVRSFFLDCLAGYSVRPLVFDTAAEAWKVWQEKRLEDFVV